MDIYNHSWLGRTLTVTASTDASLTDVKALSDETRNTVTLLEGEHTVVLNKASITFTVDDSDVIIKGAMVGQRPEDRIHRTYRKA